MHGRNFSSHYNFAGPQSHVWGLLLGSGKELQGLEIPKAHGDLAPINSIVVR